MAADRRGLGVSRLWDGAALVASSERQLLERFVAARDDLAFEAILSRHGPMVVSVCRSVLTDPSDVDDAFQATFLILVRKAGSLHDADHLSPWLHGVARRVALQARAEARKRQAREPTGILVDPTGHDPTFRDAEDRELAALLHAELDRLSLPERSAILLCDLEGLSHQEAADQLGWPLGTVKSRVTRGRERLRARLLRRGITLSAKALAATLGGEASAAVLVARTLLVTTTRGAVALVAGRGLAINLVSPPVLNLTQGVLRAMIFTKFKVGAIAIATTVLAVPSLVAYQGTRPSDPGQPGTTVRPARPMDKPSTSADSAQAEVAGGGDAIGGLRLKVARTAVDSVVTHDRERHLVLDDVRLLWYHRLAEAEVDEARTAADRIRAVESYLSRLQSFATSRARQITGLSMENRDIAISGQPGRDLNELWTHADVVESALKEAREWLTRVQADSVAKPPQAAGANAGQTPKISSAGAGATTVRNVPSPLPKSSPADEKQNQAILAVLEKRISMNFPNDTPLQDVIRYIEQSTQDQAAGFPSGIPIYVDPQVLQDVDKSMASTVAINLEGVSLRTQATRSVVHRRKRTLDRRIGLS